MQNKLVYFTTVQYLKCEIKINKWTYIYEKNDNIITIEVLWLSMDYTVDSGIHASFLG